MAQAIGIVLSQKGANGLIVNLNFTQKVDSDYKNEGFVTFKIKASVAHKFRKCKGQWGGSNSAVLDRMLTFFQRHELHPEDQLPNNLSKTEKKLMRRIDAVIAIIRDIEKTQTLPTAGMLRALFEAGVEEEPKTPRLVEKKFKGRTLEEELSALKNSM